MSEEADEQPTEEPTEEPVTLAPGLAMALAPQEEQEVDTRRRRGPDPLAALRAWKPRTRLGRMVASGQVHTYEQALDTGLPIREVEIVDALLPDLTDDVLSVNMIQRMTDSAAGCGSTSCAWSATGTATSAYRSARARRWRAPSARPSTRPSSISSL